ncbi:GDSL-type esterase/lipase family protein [Streptomyces sp. NBC_01497]|uniref:GDSL-type esterase/lipase family protein n=1 Tax=Streptomyces sp. NBC_01497 TaxID=2903885 RepID=UPI002E312BD1|nr:GDSL-type esterase/lipase family protein [Streptomyces sp. NBC_01497]
MNTQWIAGWRCALNSPFETLVLIPSRSFSSQTLRQIAHLDGGGQSLRLRIDNRFGKKPLEIGAARVALRISGDRVDLGTDAGVRFDGSSAVTVPAGQETVSDSVQLSVKAGDDLAVSMYLPSDTGLATYSNAALETAFVADGDQVSAPSLRNVEPVTERYFLSGVDVAAESGARVGVALGDSLTAGALTTINTNHRYPNRLNRRLEHSWVVNQGLGGNRLLTDEIGQRGLKRLEHDVLATPGAGTVLVNLGVNDLGIAGGLGLADANPGPPPTQKNLIDGFTELADTCHAQGLLVILATIPPFAGALYPGFDTPQGRDVRREVNEWIRTTSVVDSVADFAQVLADPEDVDRLHPHFNSGDFVHPNDAGAKAMADSIDVALLLRPGR